MLLKSCIFFFFYCCRPCLFYWTISISFNLLTSFIQIFGVHTLDIIFGGGAFLFEGISKKKKNPIIKIDYCLVLQTISGSQTLSLVDLKVCVFFSGGGGLFFSFFELASSNPRELINFSQVFVVIRWWSIKIWNAKKVKCGILIKSCEGGRNGIYMQKKKEKRTQKLKLKVKTFYFFFF